MGTEAGRDHRERWSRRRFLAGIGGRGRRHGARSRRLLRRQRRRRPGPATSAPLGTIDRGGPGPRSRHRASSTPPCPTSRQIFGWIQEGLRPGHPPARLPRQPLGRGLGRGALRARSGSSRCGPNRWRRCAGNRLRWSVTHHLWPAAPASSTLPRALRRSHRGHRAGGVRTARRGPGRRGRPGCTGGRAAHHHPRGLPGHHRQRPRGPHRAGSSTPTGTFDGGTHTVPFGTDFQAVMDPAIDAGAAAFLGTLTDYPGDSCDYFVPYDADRPGDPRHLALRLRWRLASRRAGAGVRCGSTSRWRPRPTEHHHLQRGGGAARRHRRGGHGRFAPRRPLVVGGRGRQRHRPGAGPGHLLGSPTRGTPTAPAGVPAPGRPHVGRGRPAHLHRRARRRARRRGAGGAPGARGARVRGGGREGGAHRPARRPGGSSPAGSRRWRRRSGRPSRARSCGAR